MAADFNGDGKQDLATLGGSSIQSVSQMTLFLGNGDGTFGPGVSTDVSLGPQQLIKAHLVGEGPPDLLTAGASDGEVSVLLNRCTAKPK